MGICIFRFFGKFIVDECLMIDSDLQRIEKFSNEQNYFMSYLQYKVFSLIIFNVLYDYYQILLMVIGNECFKRKMINMIIIF